MNILVLTATYEEFRSYLVIPDLVVDSLESDFKVATLQRGDFKLRIIQMGMGKVNAALSTFQFLLTGHWDLVINAGMCGSLVGAVPGTLYYGTAFIEHDFDLSPIGIPPYAISQLPRDCNLIELLRNYLSPGIIPALVITGDKFLTEFPQQLIDKGALVCDMESAAIVKTINTYNCQYHSNVQTLVLKMVSDSGSGDEYKSNQDKLCSLLAELVFKLCDIVCLGQLSGSNIVEFNTPVQSQEKEV